MNYEVESTSYCDIGDRFESQDYQRAVLAYSRAIMLDKNKDHAYTWWSNILRQQKKYDESIAKGKNAMQLQSRNSIVLRIIAASYEKKEMYDEAEQSYIKAIELNPWYAVLYLELGLLYDGFERYFQAEKQYEKAIQLD